MHTIFSGFLFNYVVSLCPSDYINKKTVERKWICAAERHASQESNLADLRKLLAGVAVENPQQGLCGGLEIFSFQQTTEILDYFCNTSRFSTFIFHLVAMRYLFEYIKSIWLLESTEFLSIGYLITTNCTSSSSLSRKKKEPLNFRYDFTRIYWF